ncbi:MAG: sulfite exporter TauE/SafE family protein [Deltaproteobacteria bacterium]|nr:MAG: sulfite exporter TauE/SafE family protein [Deltaproteobacteria bacterium]
MEPQELGLLLVAGLVAGVVNTLAGGGSLLTLPALIFLGLPPTVANGTNRVGVLLQSLVAARAFHDKGVLDLPVGRRLLVPTSLGAALGAWLSVDLDEQLFKRIIGGVMLGMVGLMLLEPQRWLKGREGEPPAHLWWSGPLAFFAIGLYGGFLQAGVGVFLLAGMVLLQGQDLLRANAVKAMLVAGFTIPPLAIFTWHGAVQWVPGLVLALGSMAGASLGARLSLAGGAKGIRYAVIAVIVVSASKLLGLW